MFAKLEQALKHLTKANASIVELKAMLPVPSTVTPSASDCSIGSLMNVVEAGTQTNDRRCDASVQTNATDVIVTTPRRKRLHPDSQVEVPTSPRSIWHTQTSQGHYQRPWNQAGSHRAK